MCDIHLFIQQTFTHILGNKQEGKATVQIFARRQI